MPFRLPIILTPIDESRDRTVWQLIDLAVYYSPRNLLTVTVPKGFKTDLASVPRLPFVWLLAGAVGNSAAVVHDFLYQKGIVARHVADAIFLEILQETGVDAWRRYPMYWAVRLLGRHAYKGKKRK